MEFEGRFPSQLENLLLPASFAARGGEFQPLNSETIIGRESLVVNWIDNENHLSDRYWIDLEHCVILKWIHVPREHASASGESVPVEISVSSIVFNEDFADSLFDAQSPFPQEFAENYQVP